MKKLPIGYDSFLNDLKARVRNARVKAALSVNRDLILLYWDIGRKILERQSKEGWGAKIIDRLAADLRREFPDMKGFSPRNLKYMRAFAQAWPKRENVQQLAAQIPWFHNCMLLDKVHDQRQREWYIDKTVRHGWSRNVLELQIESGLHARQGKASTNFKKTLPAPQSDLAQQVTKDPYVFDFLSLRDDYNERVLENDLLSHIQKFLLELGTGFAFVGRQVHLEVGGDDFYIDSLFYHLRLRCFVVIELKNQEFKPEFAGKMQFYLSAVDDLMRQPQDNPTIGLILCKGRNKVIVEYDLREVHKPVGVSGYVTKLLKRLPEKLKNTLPGPDELEKELLRSDET